MAIQIIALILIALLIIALFIYIEYARFPEKGLQGASQQLKADIISIIKGFTETPKIRHVFDITLCTEIRGIVEPYTATGMDIDVSVSCDTNGLPFIWIEYVPPRPQTEEDLATISEHIKLKFRRYLVSRNLNWKMFSRYTQNSGVVQIRVYYAEFPEDIPLLQQLYKQTISEKCAADYGYIRDDELDKELKNVGAPRI